MNLQRRDRLLKRIQTPSTPLHIVGLGRFGGNLALIRHLAELGHQLVLWESSPLEELGPSWEKLSAYHQQIKAHWACPNPTLPKDDWVFITPAMPFNHPSLKDISKEYLSTEIEVSLSLAEKHGVSFHVVLGSVGKSTCATLLARALETQVIGNIGLSFLELLPNPPSELVLELSSFQLHYLRATKWQPTTFLVTPIDDHHSDWHGGLEAYQNAKLDWVRAWQSHSILGVFMDEVKVDPDLYQLQTSKLIGQHNRNNLQAVWEITKQLQRQTDKVRQALLSFKGLPHRLELCFETAQLNCYNDSKATSPNATIEALNAFYNIELLILQGQFKELDYQPLISKAKEKCNTIWLIGGMRELMTSDLSKRQFISYKNLNEAFKNAKLPTSGNILFSPAAPSYGDYQNYEQRGDHFKTFFESS